MQRLLTVSSLCVLALISVSCVPGVFFVVENRSSRSLCVVYQISQDILLEGYNNPVRVDLEPSERHVLPVSITSFNNRTHERKGTDSIDNKTFLSLFESLVIYQVINGEEVTGQINPDHAVVEYQRRFPSSAFFVLYITDSFVEFQ